MLDGIHYAKPINTISWHPTQHIVAFCSYGGNYPVTLYSANRDPSKKQISIVEEVVEELGEKEKEADQEEKLLRRKENRSRYKQLKERALQRKLELQEKEFLAKN